MTAPKQSVAEAIAELVELLNPDLRFAPRPTPQQIAAAYDAVDLAVDRQVRRYLRGVEVIG